MARARNRLSARTVETVRKPGRYADGGGLYLLVKPSGKWWVFRFELAGRSREMGFGAVRDVSLVEARRKAEDARRQIIDGIDPLEHKRARVAVQTFGDWVERYLASLEPTWRNDKHRAQWHMTLKVHAAPLLPVPVADVTTRHVMDVLQPIWHTTPETAQRLRGRIERVLDAARAAGDRSGENPARWRGVVEHLLPRQPRVRSHHAALPYPEVPGLLHRLEAIDRVGSWALRWTILTAARTGETIGARWDEIDGDVWTVPAERMKAKRVHRVPLSGPALAVLEAMRPLGSEWIFPGMRRSRPLSNMAMAKLLASVQPGITVHGFRSSFRDWCGDCTSSPREIAEAALAHAVGDTVEAAYRRSDALAKRRQLMDAWARYCMAEAADVVRLRR